MEHIKATSRQKQLKHHSVLFSTDPCIHFTQYKLGLLKCVQLYCLFSLPDMFLLYKYTHVLWCAHTTCVCKKFH